MTTVAVTIAGRSYRMACGEGEEPHLHALARHVDQTLTGLRKGFGEIGDTRLIIMTAITVADELFEAKRRIAELEVLLADCRLSRSDGEAAFDALSSEMTTALDDASRRVEQLALALGKAERT